VLTLSDDRSICESIKAVLPKNDLVLFEHTLEDGMRRLVSMTADIVILDDSAAFGIAALNALTSVAPGTPILVLTSKSGDDISASFTLAGASACIPKPFDCEELVRHVVTCADETNAHVHAPTAIRRGASEGISTARHEQALRWMSRNTTYLDDPDRLMQSLIDAVIDIFAPARVGILMQSPEGVQFILSHGIPESITESISLSFSQGLMRQLEARSSLVDRNQAALEENSRKELAAIGGIIAIPLMDRGHTCGAVILGEKASGIDYTDSERSLLTTMVSCTSTCLEQSKQHQEVSFQQQRLNTVLSTLTAGVVMVDPNRVITMMNESAERILQLHASDVIGNSIIKLGSAFADVVLRSMKEGKPRVRHQIRDVSIKANLGLTATPMGDEGVVVIFSRIPTDEEPADSDISYSPLWEYLATRVAQEIKNPMVPINTYAQLLPTKYDSEEFRVEFSGIVQESVNRINKVVESIYEFARHPRLNKHTKDINVTIEHLLNNYKDTFARNDISIETDFSTENTEVALDPQLFDRALGNVLQNSVEAMPDGGTLKIATRREDISCSLSIEDTGPGIDDKDAPLIFMPFFSTKENGMGLGLTMADRIIREHDGRIELDQKTTEGGRFVFRLPSTADTQ
ncbi:MAG: ATP-binding protein, partial [Candidatus Hydrogenedentota bacterium]